MCALTLAHAQTIHYTSNNVRGHLLRCVHRRQPGPVHPACSQTCSQTVHKSQKAATRVAASILPQASRCIPGSSPYSPKTTLGSVPYACVLVTPLYYKQSVKKKERGHVRGHLSRCVDRQRRVPQGPVHPACSQTVHK